MTTLNESITDNIADDIWDRVERYTWVNCMDLSRPFCTTIMNSSNVPVERVHLPIHMIIKNYLFEKSMNEETVTISKDKYDELLRESLWLQALRSAGVDNWEGYDFTREVFEELKARD